MSRIERPALISGIYEQLPERLWWNEVKLQIVASKRLARMLFRWEVRSVHPSQKWSILSDEMHKTTSPIRSAIGVPSTPVIVQDAFASTVAAAKNPLSLRETTVQFSRFVAKAGPVFWFQDSVEAILKWEDPFKTLFFLSLYIVICYYPLATLLIPSGTMCCILLTTHSKRYPNAQDAELSTAPPGSPLLPDSKPPPEGSVDYLDNLKNIQQMMGRISDASDAIRIFLVGHLNWSNPLVSHTLLVISFLVTALLALLISLPSGYIPWSTIFAISGTLGFIGCHPAILAHLAIASVAHEGQVKHHGSRLVALARQSAQDDLLPQQYWHTNVVIDEVEVFENERRSLDGIWSEEYLEGDDKAWEGIQEMTPNHSQESLQSSQSTATRSSSRRRLVVKPKDGFEWIQSEDWKIDRIGLWSSIGVDEDGWLYYNSDFTIPLTAISTQAAAKFGGAARRRRWVRRAANVSPHQ